MSFDCPLRAKKLAQELANQTGKPKLVFGFWLNEIQLHQYAVWGKDTDFVENAQCFVLWTVQPN